LLKFILKKLAKPHAEQLHAHDWPRSIYQYSNMAPRFSGQNYNFFKFLFVSQFPRDLDTKKTLPNIEVFPESLGALLE